jgi:hypothetical protein
MRSLPSFHVFPHLVVVCLTLVAGAAEIAEEQAAARGKFSPKSAGRDGSVAFEVLAGDQTGLRETIEMWATEELEQQGGKYGSHGWWLWGLSAIDIDNDGDPDLIPTFDLRVTFPGEEPKIVEIKAIKVCPAVTVTPDGELAMSAPQR